MTINKNNYKDEVISATALLLSISNADEMIDDNEVSLIQEIIIDFFEVDKCDCQEIINSSLYKLKKSTDIYEFGKILNNAFTYNDKVDFICCAFEIAYSDGNLHFKEEHFIKKISNILNVEHADLIHSKVEMKKYL
tara:strand:+ start:222 stop:629 length:408 start_codon:yes stop_codon:yes gene_type:complete